MIKYTDAQQLILGEARGFGVEEIGLDTAYGRMLAEPVYADRDYPPFDRATMDGYALRRDELVEGRMEWRVRETIFAGGISSGAADGGLAGDECYKIMTGAAVPAGADIVIRREDVQELDGVVRLPAPMAAGMASYLNIARRGEDLRMGDLVVPKGCCCDASVVGLLASVGKARLRVGRMPRVRLLTTGNEIVDVDVVAGPVQIRNSNRWLLQSMLMKWGIRSFGHRHVIDDPALISEAVREALADDILICSGGVSAGDADYVPRVLAEAGVRCLFHKMAIKPGKPVWCGVMPGGGMVFALPGNPFSCLVGFVLLIEPYLRRCWGLAEPASLSLPLFARRLKRTPLDEFFPVRLAGEPAQLHAMALNGSGDIRLGMQAQALGIHPADCGDLDAGQPVNYLSIQPLW